MFMNYISKSLLRGRWVYLVDSKVTKVVKIATNKLLFMNYTFKSLLRGRWVYLVGS